MSILEDVLVEELERQRKNVASYEEILQKLPKGYLYFQNVGKRSYCYRKWRDGGKIVSEYIGESHSSEAHKAEEEYQERKKAEASLRKMRREEKRLEKALMQYGH